MKHTLAWSGVFSLVGCLLACPPAIMAGEPTPTQPPASSGAKPVGSGGSPASASPAPQAKPAPGGAQLPDISPPTDRMVEWDKIKGKWVSAQFEYEGQVYPSEGRFTLTFEKDALSWSGNIPAQVIWSGTIQVDGTTRPREINLLIKSLTSYKMQKGIYIIDGNNLAICWSTGFDGERPDKFETYDQPRRLLVRMKRAEETPAK